MSSFANGGAWLKGAGEPILVAAPGYINDNFDVMSGIEDDYVTTVVTHTGGGTFGDGLISNRYRRVKGRIHGYGRYVLGTTSTVTGTQTLTGLHPAAPTNAQHTPMSVAFYSSSLNKWFIGTGYLSDTGTATITNNTAQNLTSITPFTWGWQDIIAWSFDTRAGAIAGVLR